MRHQKPIPSGGTVRKNPDLFASALGKGVSREPHGVKAGAGERGQQRREHPRVQAPAVEQHERRTGADGLDVVRRILGGLSQHLEPGGALFVEVGDSDVRVQEAFPGLPLTWLEFEHGGGGVFLLRADDLKRTADGR